MDVEETDCNAGHVLFVTAPLPLPLPTATVLHQVKSDQCSSSQYM